MGVTARLAGYHLLGTPGWTIRAGTSPSTGVFDMVPEEADSLLDGNLRPIELEISDGQQTLKVSDLYAIQRVPGPHEHIARVLVADRRWFWSRMHIRRVYNYRRHIGVKRLEAENAQPVAFPVVDDVQYAPWSLKDGETVWSTEDIVRDIVAEIVRKEAESTGGAGAANVIFDTPDLDAVPVENLELDDPADQAVARVMSYLPEGQIVVDQEGHIRVYSRADGGHGDVLESIGPEKVDRGHIETIDLARIRPKRIDVLFTREMEVRFDFEEIETGATVARDEESRFMDNVLPVPDFNLNVAGRNLARGTWVTISQALTYWGSAPGLGDLTKADLRRAMIPYMDLWSALLVAGQRDPRQDWASRIAALHQNYRRTMRINRRWMDKFFRLNPYRVALIDPETGTRAPATLYADYSYLNSQRSLLADVRGGRDLRYAINVQGSLDSATTAITEDNWPAPARISIMDHDEGILHFDFIVDEVRLHEMLLPGLVSNNPSPDLGGVLTSPIAFNALMEDFSYEDSPQLAAGWVATMILSAIPASPNSGEQFHRVPIELDDVRDLLPEDMRGAKANGPPMEVRVSPAVETARYAWSDDKAGEIEKAFGVTEGEPQIDDLLINGEGDESAPIEAIAKAAAARVYAEFADRPQGATSVGLAPDIRPRGFISEIRHGIAASGEVSTDVTMAGERPTLSLFSLMPPGVRLVVMKLAQKGK